MRTQIAPKAAGRRTEVVGGEGNAVEFAREAYDHVNEWIITRSMWTEKKGIREKSCSHPIFEALPMKSLLALSRVVVRLVVDLRHKASMASTPD